MHALAVMHRQTLCENVDSAKIKVPIYTTDINILRVASMHRIVIHCIDISMNHYTPSVCMARFPSGNPICVFFHGKVSLMVSLCLPFDRVFCQALLAALLPTSR